MSSGFGFSPAEQALSQIFFLVVVCGLLFMIGLAIIWYVNNRLQPLLSRPARVVTKRTAVSGGGEHSAYSTYYATFEFDSGSREELEVPDQEFGMLAEGDVGTLRSQGTWFKGFDRQRA